MVQRSIITFTLQVNYTMFIRIKAKIPCRAKCSSRRVAREAKIGLSVAMAGSKRTRLRKAELHLNAKAFSHCRENSARLR